MRVNRAAGEHEGTNDLGYLLSPQSEALRRRPPFIVGGEEPISEVDEDAAAMFPQLDAQALAG